MKIDNLWNSCHVLKNLVLQRPNGSLSNNRLYFIVCWMEFNVIHFQKTLKKIIVKFTTLINPYFILFGLRSFEIIFWRALTILILLLSFKGTTQVCLLKGSIEHNKYLIPLLYMLNDCMSVKSVPEILSLNNE